MNLSNFYVIGINYRKTDTEVRGMYAVNQEQYNNLLHEAQQLQMDELFVLSTCNRTEIYAIANSAQEIISLLCKYTEGSEEKFKEVCYIKKANQAIHHLFSVAAGLDSQILGDYEIVGQIKTAVKMAKSHSMVKGFLERLINTVLQASKQIKNNTALSNGTVSVSFAAIQCIKQAYPTEQPLHIVLIGTGKIGNNTCKNLLDYIPQAQITLINRTDEKATELAEMYGVHHALYANFPEQVNQADIVIVATNSEKPIIHKHHVHNNKPQLFIDLSVPNNVNPEIAQYAHITLANVDDLSKINDETLKKREAEVPKAEAIIQEYIAEFLLWQQGRRDAVVLKAVKNKLSSIQHCDLYKKYIGCSLAVNHNHQNNTIQQIVNHTAMQLKTNRQPGCNYLQALNDFIHRAKN